MGLGSVSRVSRVSRTGAEVEQGHVGQEVRQRQDSDGKTDGPASLNDPLVTEWDPLFRHAIHGLLKVAGSDPARINDKLHNIKTILGHGTVIGDIADQSLPTIENSRVDGQVRPKSKELNGREQPGVFEKDKFMHTEQNVITAMDPPPDPHPRPEAQGDPDKRPKWMLEGSFLVFRKLEQNVEDFIDLLTKNYDKVKCATDVVFGARLMGRWKSGAPIVLFPDKDATSNPKASNDFKFMNNHICPLAAHIRKMNPRDPALGFAINARIIRNGIPYESEFSDDPTGKRGPLFACYQSSIDNGFRFLQKAWANKDDFPAKGAGFDAFIAQRPNKGKLTCAFEDKDNKIITPGLGEFSRLVTMKGGEYFFVPSMH